jgi:hypothetical protein
MKKFLFFVVTISLSSNVQAQLWKLRRLEFGFAPGTTHFSGDIGGTAAKNYRYSAGDLLFRQTGANLTIDAGCRFFENFMVRANFATGYFFSTDRKGSMRSLKSNTQFFESSILAQYFFIKNKAEDDYNIVRGRKSYLFPFKTHIDAYLFAGFGGISYKVNPNEVLAPVTTGTNGFAPVIPAGLGARVLLSVKWYAGIEAGGRYAFSDNLDGYGSSSNSTNDSYFFFNMGLVRKIKTSRIPHF